MSITDELRECINECGVFAQPSRLLAIADHIDAEHEKAVDAFERDMGMEPMTDENMAKHGWIRLPVDADGVPILVGDKMCQIRRDGTLADPFEVVGFEFVAGDVWPVEIRARCRNKVNPRYLRHHHEPTVEDVLFDALKRFGAVEERTAEVDEWLAEYAAKLRLAGEGE